MEITPTSTPLLQPQSASEPTPNRPVISSDFETFLKMLTAQMQNQDPLNPIDSTDFATQLATFSNVEQQVLTNDLLTALGAQMGAMSVSQLASWVGMDARAVMPVVFDGSPVRIITAGSHFADSADLVVRNSTGHEVQRFAIDPQRTELDWAGVSESGQPLPPGSYDISVESFSNDELIETAPVIVEARIMEARNENGRPILVMDTGQEVESANVLGLRNPS